jgi:hypothetical protein
MESFSAVRPRMRGWSKPHHLYVYAESQVHRILYRKESFLGNKLFNPTNAIIDWKLVTGAACFGLGWGIGGLCPGPAIAMFSVFNLQIHVVWFGCMIIGQQVANLLDKYIERRKKELEGSNVDSNSPNKKVEFKDMPDSDRMKIKEDSPSPSPELKINLVSNKHKQ